jgi:DNA-binding NarL/FixJ family response regulator
MTQKILIVEDDFFAAQGIASYLRDFFEVHINFALEDLSALLKKHLFDLVILDVKLQGDANGLDWVGTIQDSGAKVLVLTTQVDQTTKVSCARAKVNGYVHKNEKPESLLDKVRGALAGFLVTEPTMIADMLDPANRLPKLGWREIELVDLFIANPDATNEEFAEKLPLSAGRIKNMFQTLFRKFNVHKRMQLLAELNRLGYRPHTAD